jgi:pectin methylesterase-like acyl-CoA thioesterase
MPLLRSPLPVINLPKVTVCPVGCDFTTIAGAVNAARPNDVILVHAGTYTEPATNISIPLTIMYRPLLS